MTMATIQVSYSTLHKLHNFCSNHPYVRQTFHHSCNHCFGTPDGISTLGQVCARLVVILDALSEIRGLSFYFEHQCGVLLNSCIASNTILLHINLTSCRLSPSIVPIFTEVGARTCHLIIKKKKLSFLYAVLMITENTFIYNKVT